MVANQNRLHVAEPPFAHGAVRKGHGVACETAAAVGQRPYFEIGADLLLGGFAVADAGVVAVGGAGAVDGEGVGGEGDVGCGEEYG